jgi:hypothetical protein
MSELNELNLDMEVGAPVDEYEKPSNVFRPPEPGEYTLTRSTEKALDWQPTKDGNIWTNVRFIIQGGDLSGRSVFSTLSTYVGKFRKASSVQDFFASCGIDYSPKSGTGRFTIQEIKDNVEQTFGPFNAYIDWQLYCPTCDETVIKKASGFPRDGDGNLINVVNCPKCGAKGLGAKAVLKRYIM